MSDATVISPILSSAVGLVGALVAGMTVYLNYRGRHNQFRQVAYGKQMDAYFDIAGAMADLFTAAQNALAYSPGLRGEEVRLRMRSALRREHEHFTAAVNRALIVLPSRVKSAVDQFNETLLAICDPGGEMADGVPHQALTAAYERAINCIRHHLAIDSLTSGLLREMGIGSESVPLKSIRQEVNPLVPVGRAAH